MISKYQQKKKRTKKSNHSSFSKANHSGKPLEVIETCKIIGNNISMFCCPRLNLNIDDSQRCSLVIKDSEWIDIARTSTNKNIHFINDCNTPSGENIAHPEINPQIQPMTRMFPKLLQEPPATLEAIANKTISTTEVTKHLVGHKANFEFLKKVNRLIPPEKEWLPQISECSNTTDSRDFSDIDKCPPSSCTGNPVDIAFYSKFSQKNKSSKHLKK